MNHEQSKTRPVMNRGFKGLEERVLSKNLCTACGACLSLCPYLCSWKGMVAKLDTCNLEEGRCYAYCPRTEVNPNETYRAVFGKDYDEIELGPTLKILMGRAKRPAFIRKGQTGGVVSSLVDFAMKDQIIQSALLTYRNKNLIPAGKIISKRKDILTCAGSSYISGPTLESFNQGSWKGKIGIVGLPCQVLALARMRASSLEKKTPIEQIGLVIGLFCTWALDHRPFLAFLNQATGDHPITKLNITPPPDRFLEVTKQGKFYRIPVEEVRPFIRPGCKVCLDMTAELSDISVGTVEGKEGWSTVVVRTKTGEGLLRRAKRAGMIETKPLPRDHLNHLKEASLLKKRRALDALQEKGGIEKAYFTLPGRLIERILSETEGISP